MRKAYSNYSEIEPYTDGCVDTSYFGTGYSDPAWHPVVGDAEGSKNPFPFVSSHNRGGYVLKSERIVEHISHTAPVLRYRYVSEPAGDYYNRYGQHGLGYDYPKKVEDFLDKVQNDVSRPAAKASAPFTSDWRTGPNYMGNPVPGATKYSDDSDHFWEKPSEAYPQTYKKTIPDDYYEKPRANEGPIKPSHPFSKPTNDIGTAVNFLTEAIKPMNVQADGTRPNNVVPLSSIPWRTGTNLAAKDHKVDSDEDNWENPKEQQMYGRSKIIPGLREPTNRIDNKQGYYEKANNNKPAEYYEKPFPIQAPSQQPPFTVPTTMQNNKYAPQPPPDTIDSSEARRRYGKTKSQQVPEDAHTGTIDSNEVVRKYKGTKVPW